MLDFTGGTLTIVDPAASTGTGNCALRVFPYSGLNVSSGPGWQLNLGNGSVTNNGGHSNGYVLNLTGQNSATYKISNLRINTGLGGINRHVNPIEGLIPLHHLTIISGEYRTGTTHFISGDIQVVANGTLTWNGIINFSEWNGNAGIQGSIPQQIINNGVIRNSNFTVTANLNSLILNNTGGLTLQCPLTISNSLLLTKGIIHTSATNTLHLGGFSFAGALATQSVFGNDTHINGPFSRTFTTGTANNAFSTNTNLFPVGTGGVYYPVWVSPTTIFQTVFTAEVFNDGLGTPGQDVSNMSGVRWALSSNIPEAVTNAHVQIGDINLVSSGNILQAPSAAGIYSGIVTGSLFTAGTPNTLKSYPNNSPIPNANFTGFVRYGDLTPCNVPAAQPTSLNFSAISRTSLIGMFTAATPAPTGYLVVRYPTAATPVNPVDGTAYGTGQTLGTGVIVAAGPSTSFTNTGLSNNTTYDYYVYSYHAFSCGGGPVYLTTNPLTGTVTTCNTVVNQISGLINTDRTQTTLNIQWTASTTPGVSYFVDVATDAGFLDLVQFNLSAGTGTSYQITGLTAGINYHFRVRAFDPVSGCFSTNISAQQITLCPATSIPYTENLDGLTRCLSRINAGTGSNWNFVFPPAATGLTGNAASISSGSGVSTNSYLVTRAVNLTGGTSYNLTFRYINGSSTAAFSLDMIYSAANPVNGGIVLANNIVMGTIYNIGNSISQTATFSFIPVTSGEYYIMFNAIAPPTTITSTLYIDDIEVIITPQCSNPLGGTITNFALGQQCGNLNSTTLLANGYSYSLGMTYQWEKSSDGVNFTNMGAIIFHPAQPYLPFVTDVFSEGNNYYRLRSECANGPVTVYSNVTGPVEYSNPQPLTTTGGVRCGPGTVNLSGTANGGDELVWYANPTGGLPLGTGSTFTTPTIFGSTDFYVAAVTGYSDLSMTSPTIGNSSFITNSTGYGLRFTVNQPVNITSVTIRAASSSPGASSIQIKITDLNDIVLYNGTLHNFTITAAFETYIIPVNISGIVPGNYKMVMTYSNITGMMREVSGLTFPYCSAGNEVCITAGANGTGTSQTAVYFWFYNWVVTTGCEGIRSSVSAIVTPPPALTLSSMSETICEGNSTPVVNITSEIDNFDTYTWSPPTGVTGSAQTGFIFNPTVSTLYSLTASQSVPPNCQNIANINIQVTPSPVIVLATATPSMVNCGGSSQLNVTIQNPVNNYAFTTSTGNSLLPLSNPVNIFLSGAGDTPSGLINIDFDFLFDGMTYNQISVSPDGFIKLGSPAASNQFSNSVTSTMNIPKLYPYWDDLSTGTTGYVRYSINGMAPDRILIVEWFVTMGSLWTLPANATFQALLYEGSNKIEFRYGAMASANMSSSVGLTGNNPATNFNCVTISTNTNSTTTANNNNTGQPENGRMYTFTPTAYSYSWMPATYLNNPNIRNPMAENIGGNITYNVVVTEISTGCSRTSNDVVITADNCSVGLNLTAYIEGYMDGGSMRPVLLNSGVMGATASQADTITVSLHNNTAPYAKAYEYKGVLGTNGTMDCTFPAAANGGNYYIVVTHRNALETWSASPMIFTGTNSYNFSTAATQAFGSNMVQVGSNWCIYSGDIDNDGEVLPADYTLWLISNINGDIGYFETDLDGDGEVLPGDYTIWLINNSSGILISRP
jgi:hypothetical protein